VTVGVKVTVTVQEPSLGRVAPQVVVRTNLAESVPPTDEARPLITALPVFLTVKT
jgi:hypothetical protein